VFDFGDHVTVRLRTPETEQPGDSFVSLQAEYDADGDLLEATLRTGTRADGLFGRGRLCTYESGEITPGTWVS